jgi:hypothetical protein
MENTMEKIEEIKDRIEVTYGEAKEALEESKGSVLDAIIYLEERNENKLKNKPIMESSNFFKNVKDKIILGKDSKNDSEIENMYEDEKTENKPMKWGFILGLISILLGGLIGMIPLLAIIFSSVGLYQYDDEENKKRWKGFVGVALGGIYFLVNMHNYGHI